MPDPSSPITPKMKRSVRTGSLALFFFIIIATGFFGTLGAIVAAVVIAVVGVAFVLWLRRLVAEGKASGQWNAGEDA
jgi:predicted PurR-regulated permease PerM|tara:strand:- start:167 stop:397 length:231 start_codon:yes stop_codon:yes gene_type:complete